MFPYYSVVWFQFHDSPCKMLSFYELNGNIRSSNTVSVGDSEHKAALATIPNRYTWFTVLRSGQIVCGFKLVDAFNARKRVNFCRTTNYLHGYERFVVHCQPDLPCPCITGILCRTSGVHMSVSDRTSGGSSTIRGDVPLKTGWSASFSKSIESQYYRDGT